MSGRTLSKSRFIKGLECPRKLVYGQDKRYRNRSNEDGFLASLAEGGFQVGEFAKSHFPGGHDIVTLDAESALSQTQAYLDAGDCVIFEAAIKYQNCFVQIRPLQNTAIAHRRTLAAKRVDFMTSIERYLRRVIGVLISLWGGVGTTPSLRMRWSPACL